MRSSAKKLTTAAVCAALSVIMCTCTVYLPFSFMPLYIAAFCIFLACKRANLAYGTLCAVATAGIMFSMSGLSVSWFMFVLMFAPYGIIAYFIHRYGYFRLPHAIIRAAVVTAYFNMSMFLVYLTATRVVTIGLDIDVTAWVSKLGGYWALALAGTAVLGPLDFMFYALSCVVLKRIPMPDAVRQAPPKRDLPDIFYADAAADAQGTADAQGAEEPKDEAPEGSDTGGGERKN